MNAGRGSRPGFSSSCRMSVTVGRPNVSSTNSVGLQRRAARSLLPISVARSRAGRLARIRRTTGYASGCTLEASSGSSPPGMRRKPAHCSNAFGPSRATSLSAVRERNGPLVSRCGTMFSASAGADAGDPGQQRRRRGVDVDADARSRSPRRPRPASATASPRTGRAGTGRRRSTSGRSSPARPAGPAAGGRSRPRRAARRPGRAAPARRTPRPSTPTRRPRRPRPWSASAPGAA